METSELSKIAESEENSRIRAEIWGDFVGWDKRRRGENGFLINQLYEHRAKKVFDVALGDGVDTIYLLQRGFEVSANELDDAFRQKAVENAQRAGLTIAPTTLDWRRLSEEYASDSHDAIICFGNSLTCLMGRGNQLEALHQFRRVLKPRGVLLIDERNYQKILGNREEALAGRLHSPGKYIYTGTEKVGAKFAAISDGLIIIEYTHKESGQKAYYNVYPFGRGKLLELLQQAGFSKVEQFSDYEPGANPDADFYQYVCVK